MSKRTRTRHKLIGDTPERGGKALIPHLAPGVTYWEPCAGRGCLIDALEGHAECVVATDIVPRREGIFRTDCMAVTPEDFAATGADLIITNPPWPAGGTSGAPAVPMLDHLSQLAPTWALLAWDFAANVYAGRLQMAKAVPVGRLSWQMNGRNGYENAGWFLFDAHHTGAARIYTRRA